MNPEKAFKECSLSFGHAYVFPETYAAIVHFSVFFPTRFDNLESWRRCVGKTQIIDTYIGIYNFSFYK